MLRRANKRRGVGGPSRSRPSIIAALVTAAFAAVTVSLFRTAIDFSSKQQPTAAGNMQMALSNFANGTSHAITSGSSGSGIDPFANRSCTCCCWNSAANHSCCERTLRPIHKMGFYATLDLVRQLGHVFGTHVIYLHQGFRTLDRPNFGRAENDVDYRDVIVARNVYAALVSGYLYHRAGRECWLDPHGEPWQDRVDDLWNFERYMPAGGGSRRPRVDPPSRGRSLCEYLANETEAAGMKVYTTWAFHVYYDQLLRHHEFATSSPERRSRALFACFEKLTSGRREDLREFLWQVYDLFFPAGGTRVMIKPKNDPYSGGHATSQDANLRSRLVALIEKNDKEHFNGMVANFQSTFNCG